MMTQSVMKAADLAFSNKAASTTAQKQTGMDFGKLVNQSMKSDKTASAKVNTAAYKKDSSKTQAAADNGKSDTFDSNKVKPNSAQTDNAVKTPSKQTGNKAAASQTEVDKAADSINSDTDKTETAAVAEPVDAQLIQMLESFSQTVMDKLNLTQEEFNQQLTSQGMSAADLLQQENLQQFILGCNGKTDIVAALTDENLADALKQLQSSLSDIKEEYNTGLTDDQVKAVLERAEALKELMADTAAAPSINEDVKAVSQNKVETDKSKAEDASKTGESQTVTAVQTETDGAKADSLAAAGTNNSEHSSTDSNSGRDLKSENKLQNFVDNLVNASQNLQTDTAEEVSQVAKLRDIANQIIESIKVTVSSDKTSMELQLNPESLGKVNFSVHARDGVLTAHFIVQNEISKEAIESQMQTLRDTLSEQGIKVEAIEVTVASNAFDSNSSKGSDNQQETKESQSGKHITMEEALNMTEESGTEEATEAAEGIRGSMIDYTA